MSRVIAILAAVSLCACATPPPKKALGGWPEYSVDGTIGLVVTARATPANVVAPDNGAAASLDAAAEKKRREQSLGVGATLFTILVAPLAILAPLYPPAIQLAILPFQAVDATSKAGEAADRFKEAAANARLDAACGEQLGADRPELAEKLQAAVPKDALLQSIQRDVLESLHARARVPVVPLEPQSSESEYWNREAVFKNATEREIPTVFAVELQSLDVRAEAAGSKPGDCRYAITTVSLLTWWNVKENLKVYQPDAPGAAKPLLVTTDLPALLEQPEAFRLQLARAYRDAVIATLEVPTLKFVNAQP